MRLLAELPEIEGKIQKGELTLTTVAQTAHLKSWSGPALWHCGLSPLYPSRRAPWLRGGLGFVRLCEVPSGIGFAGSPWRLRRPRRGRIVSQRATGTF